ncbi:unnamed protein product [Caenorhabditis angaria]|uniref:Glycine zipper domain-containing protein n=1 Tax=Caenorhabditis angaria TaxID=860376 RepID=A0A9P1MYN5_9PELO|nr:unnamed protein product [Caenorhabditis angaria]
MSDDTKNQHTTLNVTKAAVSVAGTVAKSTPLSAVGVALDVADVGLSVYDDRKNSTTRNTVTTISATTAGFGGGVAGGLVGATAGTAICPGIGTIVGGIVGGVIGGVGARFGAKKAINKVGDDLEYDIEILVCSKCGEQFECHVYKTGRAKSLCEDCR